MFYDVLSQLGYGSRPVASSAETALSRSLRRSDCKCHDGRREDERRRGANSQRRGTARCWSESVDPPGQAHLDGLRHQPNRAGMARQDDEPRRGGVGQQAPAGRIRSSTSAPPRETGRVLVDLVLDCRYNQRWESTGTCARSDVVSPLRWKITCERSSRRSGLITPTGS